MYIKDEFLRDVSKHEMKIEHDSGLHRSVLFENPASRFRCHWFRLVTYPGGLLITGDVGAHVFERLPDMFDFFRCDDLTISADYWAQKCVSRWNKEYCAEAFKACVIKEFRNWYRSRSREKRRDTWERLRAELLDAAYDFDTLAAIQKACDFEGPDGFHLGEFWTYSIERWDALFLWNCYAIVWGIQQYDAAIRESAA